MLRLTVHKDAEFWLYVHDTGEEYYLHYDFWPKVPFIYKTKSQEINMDIVVRKQLERANENCKEQPYSYFGKIVL